ncbi:DUF3343 domain-containing protein [Moorella sulfitireducens (nom. illeg.)]|uniref:DUF3343 domain-containing protein n=1 Tax=Neomoorella sulfitireducens TaxID=2972948 RepID=UPI0021ACF846|nr:DUF3343 domain-containing protein [Moorella sulfitireducens]
MVLGWLKNKTAASQSLPAGARGLVIFATVEEAMKGEKVLRQAGCDCRLVAPPPGMRQGCDLALEIDLVEQPAVARALAGRVAFTGIYPLKGEMEPLQVDKVTRFADHIMVKAGNMKLVFEKKTGVIVNISGGGCPDIPYLYTRLVGTRLDVAPRPRDEGRTLCALMLDRALEKALAIWKGAAPG